MRQMQPLPVARIFIAVVALAEIPSAADTIGVPAEAPTIQAAIDIATNGDMIIVSPGVYAENIHFRGKRIRLTSLDPLDPVIVESTIIDGRGLDSTVQFAGIEGIGAMLSGFSIANGAGPYGGGIRGNGTEATVSHCVVRDNSAESGGGIFGCNGEIARCEVTRNVAYEGAGLFRCDASIRECHVHHNDAGGHGGGLYDCIASLRLCELSNNTAATGGAMSLCDAALDQCTLTGNVASYAGGALETCVVDAYGGTIEQNRARDGGGLAYCDGILDGTAIIANQAEDGSGGGIYMCDCDVIRCSVTGNTANNLSDNGGGGLYGCNGNIVASVISDNSCVGLLESSGGALSECHGSIERCMIANNSASVSGSGSSALAYGGGLAYCDGSVSNCWILDNRASGVIGRGHGGGLANCNAAIKSCVIAENSALGAGGSGGGLYLCNEGIIQNCTIVGNWAEGKTGGLYFCSSAVISCVIWSNRSSQAPFNVYAGSIPVYSCIEGGGDGEGTIASEPLFVEPGYWTGSYWSGGDYHLTKLSACIDSGDPGFVANPGEVDIDGEPRILRLRVDIGADEFPTDCNSNGILDTVEISAGTSDDCDTNGVPDGCSVAAGTTPDCDGNDVPDSCDLRAGTGLDCNGNTIPDVCDIAFGSSGDCDTNAVPDECEIDEDSDGIIDSCDSCAMTPSGVIVDYDGCAVPYGPCCFSGGICIDEAEEADCAAVGGAYFGDGFTCDGDLDGDGAVGCEDSCPVDGGKTAPGICGCSVADVDADGDGVVDCHDACPDTADGVPVNGCGCPMLGACCFPSFGFCWDDVEFVECIAIGGVYHGDGSICDEGCGFADFDEDGDVDLHDFAMFQRCFTGTGGGPVGPECLRGDIDRCGAVDLVDFEAFHGSFTGP